MHFSRLAPFQDDLNIKKLHPASCYRGSSLLLTLYFFPPDRDYILFQLPQYQLKKTSRFYLLWNKLRWKAWKRNLHWQEDQVFLWSFFCETFSVSAKQNPSHLNLPIFSLFIFRTSEDKELVCKPSFYKINLQLIQKDTTKRKRWYCGEGKKQGDSKHRCILCIFSIWKGFY